MKKCAIDSENFNKNDPFKRGAMQFEDFNYDMYNPYILRSGDVEPDSESKVVSLDPQSLLSIVEKQGDYVQD